MTSVQQVCQVQLLRFPLRVWHRSQEQHEGLLREFALVSIAADEYAPAASAAATTVDPRSSVPRRLLELIDYLTKVYQGSTAAGDVRRDEALACGEQRVDLSYPAPVSSAADIERIQELLDEADDFCRGDDYLLTLASTEEAAAFRRWYFGQFLGQIAGEPPSPWPGTLD